MNCEEVRELLPAYVLGALDLEDLEAVELHLRTGHEHDDELVELRSVVFALERLPEAEALSVLEVAQKQPFSLPGSGLFTRISDRTPWRIAVAAVVLLAVFGAGWFFTDMTRGKGGQEVTLLLQGPNGESLSLKGSAGQGSVTGTMAGLERLSDDRIYQVWAIRDGTWVKVGACNTNAEGWWNGTFAFQIREGERIALTVEPVPGSASPTSAPILISSS